VVSVLPAGVGDAEFAKGVDAFRAGFVEELFTVFNEFFTSDFVGGDVVFFFRAKFDGKAVAIKAQGEKNVESAHAFVSREEVHHGVRGCVSHVDG